MKAYLFWYRSTETSPTEYMYVIAHTYKQARYFWYNYLKFTLGYAYDYDLDPVNEIDSKDFVKEHFAGDILGQNAII